MSVHINNHEKTGVLPVINIPQQEFAVPVAKALRDGGVNSIEVTLRSSGSLESIKRIKSEFSDMTVGAGTVMDKNTVDAALEAGADFIVSPGFDEELVNYCNERKVQIVPGCVMATEIQNAVKCGLKTVKFFPAELNGGIEAIKLLSGPFPDVKFVPTGGINFNNLGVYLSNKKILACGGSYMATAEQIKNRNFEGITAACKRAVDISLGFQLAHIGINCDDEQNATDVAERISDIFRMSARYMNSAVFAGTVVEAVKNKGFGKLGHIGFSVNSVDRAIAYFESKGIELNRDSIRRNSAGEITCIYLKDEIGGFAFHVVEK